MRMKPRHFKYLISACHGAPSATAKRESSPGARRRYQISDIKGSIGHFEKRSDANYMSMGLGFAFMDCVQALNKAIVHVVHHPSLDLKAGG